MIVVDRESKDGTQDIAKKHGCVVLIDTISLGSARMAGIKHSQTAWIAFIDSDIAIGENWHDDMISYIDNRTGAVQGRTIVTSSPIREMRLHDARTRLFRQGPRYLRKGDRGFTNTTMIRRDLLTDLDISDINAFEDYFITQAVIDKGYHWKYVPVLVDHMETSEDWLDKIEWGSKGRMTMFTIAHASLATRLKSIIRDLSWYLKEIVKYSIILGDKRIPPLFGKAFLLELRGVVR